MTRTLSPAHDSVYRAESVGIFAWRHLGSNLPRRQAAAALICDTAVVACARTK